MESQAELQNPNVSEALTAVTISLKVKARDLYPFGQYDQDKINLYTELSDGINTVTFGQPKADLETEVDLKTKVDWTARTNDPSGDDSDYSVEIAAYLFKAIQGSTSVLGKYYIQRSPTGKVEGQVLNDNTLRKKEDIYAIIFKIHWISKNETKEFTIDPKLKVKPER